MGDLFNIKSSNFLGGQNVHNAILITLAGFIVFKLVKR